MVEVSGSNLYTNGFVAILNKTESLLLRDLLVITPTEQDKWHTVVADDTITRIAWEHYSPFVANSSRFWWIIADANNILDPMDLSELVGTDILIPDILRIVAELNV